MIYRDGEHSYLLPTPELHAYFGRCGGVPERPLIDWAGQNFANPRRMFIDVGAHVGTWTIRLAKLFAGVVAFEPQLDIFYRLCGSVAESGLSNRVICIRAAVGDQNGGTKQLRITNVGGGDSSVVSLTSNQAPWVVNEPVPCCTLDNVQVPGVMGNLPAIGLLKIDVEGAELDVLKGAMGVLERDGWPPILFECWQDERGQRREELFTFVRNRLRYHAEPIVGYPEMWLAQRIRG